MEQRRTVQRMTWDLDFLIEPRQYSTKEAEMQWRLSRDMSLQNKVFIKVKKFKV